jgi:hypothetical protein
MFVFSKFCNEFSIKKQSKNANEGITERGQIPEKTTLSRQARGYKGVLVYERPLDSPNI